MNVLENKPHWRCLDAATQQQQHKYLPSRCLGHNRSHHLLRTYIIPRAQVCDELLHWEQYIKVCHPPLFEGCVDCFKLHHYCTPQIRFEFTLGWFRFQFLLIGYRIPHFLINLASSPTI